MAVIGQTGFAPVPVSGSMARMPAHQIPANAGKDKIKAVSQDFETIFLTNMFENMFDGLEDDGPFGSGAGNGPWRSMLTEQYAKSIAQSGGIGVAKQIERQLVSLQESHQ
ncbi:MAG TPA: rod-binding protein [Xanthobacteraceae bacterium]|jgi:Rod binding domain-containing protein|nr:rod-binding protein [Xanthobacteraceae bacterium]